MFEFDRVYGELGKTIEVSFSNKLFRICKIKVFLVKE